MDFENIIAETKEGGVALITLHRPDALNALNGALIDELGAAVDAFEADDSIGCIVVTGSEKAFAAGADIKEMQAKSYMDAYMENFISKWERITKCRKPVIAAVSGHACAGGLGVALRCDIRIADASAVFGVFSRRFGVPMSDGTTVRLPRVVGMGFAQDMLITGRAVQAEEALRIGLITRLIQNGAVLDAAITLGKQIAAVPQTAMNSDRHSAYAQAGLSLTEAFTEEIALAESAKAADAQSGAARFAAGVGRHGGREIK